MRTFATFAFLLSRPTMSAGTHHATATRSAGAAAAASAAARTVLLQAPAVSAAAAAAAGLRVLLQRWEFAWLFLYQRFTKQIANSSQHN